MPALARVVEVEMFMANSSKSDTNIRHEYSDEALLRKDIGVFFGPTVVF